MSSALLPTSSGSAFIRIGKPFAFFERHSPWRLTISGEQPIQRLNVTETVCDHCQPIGAWQSVIPFPLTNLDLIDSYTFG